MNSSIDFEKVWFLYKTEGEPKGMSINAFCVAQGVPYTQFDAWFRRSRAKICPIEVENVPEELVMQQTSSSSEKAPSKKARKEEKAEDSAGIRVVINSRSGLRVCKSNLTYQELKELVEKLEFLC